MKSDGSSPRDLYVANTDGTGGERLLASHPEATNAGGIRDIVWSPDETITCGLHDDPVYADRLDEVRADCERVFRRS